MGDRQGRGSAMTTQWLVDVVSRMLEPDERDAVRGDLAESGATGRRALREVLGLVARWQTALWMDWRPWLALMGVVIPLGLLLSQVSRSWANSTAIYAFLIVNNWTWSYLEYPDLRLDILHRITGFVLHSVTLIGWAWTSGFVLGSLSRRTLWVTATLFCLAVFGGTLGSTTVGARNPFNAPVFALTFYSLVLPLLMRTVLVVLPAYGACTKVAGRPCFHYGRRFSERSHSRYSRRGRPGVWSIRPSLACT